MDDPLEIMQQQFKDGEAFLKEHSNPNRIRLNDKYSYSIRFDISQRKPYKTVNFNEVNIVVLRGNSQEVLYVDLNRDDFIKAVEDALNVRIVESDD